MKRLQRILNRPYTFQLMTHTLSTVTPQTQGLDETEAGAALGTGLFFDLEV